MGEMDAPPDATAPPVPPRAARPMRRALRRAFRAAALVSLAALAALLLHARAIWREPLDLRRELAERLRHGRFDDRHGEPLRYFPNIANFTGHPAALDGLPPFVPRAFLAAEDARFFDHAGLDPLAILRAASDNLRAGRVVSGASTIPQQIVRRMFPRDRSPAAKFREAVRALKLSRRVPKARLLEAYLNLVPMGGEIEGVGLAARTYFGKPPEALSLSEAACLAALPKAPSRYLPRDPASTRRLVARRDRILTRMGQLGFASSAEVALALASPVRFATLRARGGPSHLIDWLVARAGEPAAAVATTVDGRIQATAARLLAAHRIRLARLGASQAACVVLDARDASLAAMVGSLEYGPRSAGFVNGALARRSAGSILKPFLYAIALEAGRGASALLSDTVERYRTPVGDYLPLNATRTAYGPVMPRTALGNSLNLAAVRMVGELTPERFLRRLADFGLAGRDEAASRYGLGLAIGNLEVDLLTLAGAYLAFSRAGRHRAVACLPGTPFEERQALDPRVAYIVTDMLADPAARVLTFGTPAFFAHPYPVPLKTGTSTRSRDGWLVAATPRHVIALWAGNFDGRPTAGAGGAVALGPILADLLRELYPPAGPGRFARPDGIAERTVCGFSGRPPNGHCPAVTRELFLAEHPPEGVCDFHDEASGPRHLLDASFVDWNRERRLRGGAGNFAVGGLDAPRTRIAGDDGMPPRIVSPRDGDRFVIDPFGRNEIRLQAETRTPHPELIWFLNGQEIGRTPPPYRMMWRLSRGAHTLAVATPGRARAVVRIRVE